MNATVHSIAPAAARVLVLDDDPAIRELLGTALGRRGYRVTCAEEPEEAAALLAFRDFDLVCIDLDLSGLNGLEGLGLLSETRARLPRQRIVVITGNPDPNVHEACRSLGASSVHPKSGSLAELQALFQALLKEGVS
jgi:CheY-like chemotaxis protein